ncbi:MAG: peptidoglycan DD-metalloendopeptidase family protein [Clostridia bacterium]|nr:peptidoglycan DD-metalloendopeptidase family protein [Clostridia bacterium]
MKIKKNKRDLIKRIAACLCALLIVTAFLASVVMPVIAAPSQSQLNDAKKKTDDAKKDVDAAEAKYSDAIKEFNALDNEISRTEDEIIFIENEIQQAEKDLELKEKELEKAEKEFNEYQSDFLTRAQVMYENGDVAYIEIIFGAKSFSDFIERIELISQMMQYDNEVLDKLEEAKQIIIKAKQEIEDIIERQNKNKENLLARKSTLEKNLAKKQALVDSLSQDVEKYKAIYESAERAEQALINSNKNALSYSSNPVKYTGGKFLWPVPSSSRITSQYGYRIHPVYKTKKFHSGIDIGAGYGVDILASADGTVTLAATNGGYGKCVIVNHGSGITTLYAHNSSLLVSQGEKVTKGQVIAKAGSTGVSTGPHLHFEVRVNGATANPLDYLK